MTVFDTDAVSLLLRRQPSPSLVEVVGSIDPYDQATSAITVGELAYGAARARRLGLYVRARKLLDLIRILPFDEDAGEVYAVIRRGLEQRGITLTEPDLRIAAIALRHDAQLLTGNVRHFRHVPGLLVRTWERSAAG